MVAALRAAGCVYAEEEAELLLAQGPEHLEELVGRRVAGVPLEQVLGWAEFCGTRIVVQPGVFVPRQRTSFLVAQAVILGGSVVVDLCCGSGAVARRNLTRPRVRGGPVRGVAPAAARL